jgi:hypothetical protein
MKTLTEILVNALSGTKIFEMAYSREKYMDLAHSLTDQIVQNWCLVKYCNMYDEENYNRLHWSKELIAHLSNLQRQRKLKGGISVERTLKIVWFEREELNNPKMVEPIIEIKFDFENINTDLTEIANEFVKHLDKIIYIITKGTYSELKQYVYNEI